MLHLVQDLLYILTAGLLAALVCKRLGVSTLLGYLLAGALLGPGMLELVTGRNHDLRDFAEVGIFFLLFSIGLELSLEELTALARSILLGGGAQMLLVAVPLALILPMFGMSQAGAILIGCALAFSSTVLVFKALAEAGQAATRAGRRTISILLFQDAALVPLLLLIPLLTQETGAAEPRDYLLLGGTSLIFIASIPVARSLLRGWVIPMLAAFRSPEVVVLFTLVILGGVTFVAYQVGLPPAVGAFTAGLVLSGNRWTAQIDALTFPFRETFAAVFFVSLGLLFHPVAIVEEPLSMLGMFLGLLMLKALAAILALRLAGLRWSSALALGFGLAHVGEFAFVLLAQGQRAGLLSEDFYQQLVTLGFGTLLLTPLLLRLGSHRVEKEAEERGKPGLLPSQPVRRALVIGIGPVGRSMASHLETCGCEVSLIDQSPVNLYPFAQQGFSTVAGDASDPEVLRAAHVASADLIVVCVPDDERALDIVREVRGHNSHATLLVRSRFQSNRRPLIAAGANGVVSEEWQSSKALRQMLDELEIPKEG